MHLIHPFCILFLGFLDNHSLIKTFIKIYICSPPPRPPRSMPSSPFSGPQSGYGLFLGGFWVGGLGGSAWVCVFLVIYWVLVLVYNFSDLSYIFALRGEQANVNKWMTRSWGEMTIRRYVYTLSHSERTCHKARAGLDTNHSQIWQVSPPTTNKVKEGRARYQLSSAPTGRSELCTTSR